MSLSSLFRKNKQETPEDDQTVSRAKDESNPKRARARRKALAADDDTVDPVLPEKKRARRRLIGAVALVLAAVIGLPMVLDSEPRPLAQDIDIRIPSKETSEPRRVSQAAALDPAEQVIEAEAKTPASRASAPQGGSPHADKPAPNPAKAQAAEAAADKPAAPAAIKPAGTQSPAAVTNEAKPAAKPDAHGKEGKAAKAETKLAAAGERESQRAMAILEGKDNGKSEAGKSAQENRPGKYSIQVAALSSQDKVNELRGKLKTAGIPSQTQKVPTASGERIRVRVGPFASKDEAEKMRARLVKMGLNGSLVPLGE